MSTKSKREHRGRSNRLCQLSAATAILFLLAMPWAVSAATIRVNTFEDELNADGDCSLREAITSANRRLKTDACEIGTGRDLIVLPGGTYTLRTIDNDTDGPNGLPSILRTMSISAAAGSTAIIERADDAPLFRILHTVASLGVFDVVLAGGDAGTGEGGGLFNAGSITVLFNTVIRGNKATRGGGIFNSDNVSLLLEGVTVEHNRAISGGGGIVNSGLLTVAASIIRNNRSDFGGGGGIFNQGGVGTIEASSVIGNSAGGGAGVTGGGIRNEQGTLTITNSTISGNQNITGNGRGGGINNVAAILNLNNVTITKNRAQIAGGGISNASVGSSVGTVNLKNTIIAGNTREGNIRDDCSGVFTSLGVNLIQEITSCTVNGGTVVSADPRLGPLANNGGLTLNHILLVNSDAIDKGSQAVPGSGGDACERRDQRGVIRPEDGDNTSGAICDLGAVEVQFPPPRALGDLQVSFEPRPETFKTVRSSTGCPAAGIFAGKFEFSARLRNLTGAALSNLVVGVRSFGGGTGLFLQNADGGPGGVGIGMTVPRLGNFQDGVLRFNEFVDVPFSICLPEIEPFTFFVDLFGSVQ